jgi:hypothetical protein
MRVLVRLVVTLSLLLGALGVTAGPVAAATCNGWLLKGEYKLYQWVNGDVYGTGQVEEYFRGCWDGTIAYRNPAYAADPTQFFDWWTSNKPTVTSESISGNSTALVKAYTTFELGNHTGVCPLKASFLFRIELDKNGSAVGYLSDSEPCWPTVVDYWYR